MFPDTPNFSDPAYTSYNDPAWNDYSLPGDSAPGISVGVGSLSTGGASVNTPAQGSSTGASILGWLSLANNVANTVVNASRGGSTSRPGVNKSQTSLGSFGTVGATTLVLIIAAFVGAIFLLRK